MVPQIVQIIIWILIFAAVAYFGHWVCVNFKMPDPVFWAFGALLLIILLLVISGQIPGPALLHLRP